MLAVAGTRSSCSIVGAANSRSAEEPVRRLEQPLRQTLQTFDRLVSAAARPRRRFFTASHGESQALGGAVLKISTTYAVAGGDSRSTADIEQVVHTDSSNGADTLSGHAQNLHGDRAQAAPNSDLGRCTFCGRDLYTLLRSVRPAILCGHFGSSGCQDYNGPDSRRVGGSRSTADSPSRQLEKVQRRGAAEGAISCSRVELCGVVTSQHFRGRCRDPRDDRCQVWSVGLPVLGNSIQWTQGSFTLS